MDDLRRELAPIVDGAWAEIDEEAKRALKLALAARKVVDFEGPLGWSSSSVALGRADAIAAGGESAVQLSVRRVLPLVELRASFELSRAELDAVARGAKDPDLAQLVVAAQALAAAEDRAVFYGLPDAGIGGIFGAASDATLSLTTDYESYPRVVAEALSILRKAGVQGPYAIALGPQCFKGLSETTVGGYPVLSHVTRLIDGPVIWAPAVSGAVVLSQRGGDFELTVGRDISIGYESHTVESVKLYFQESLTFRVLTPEAAVPLVYR